MSILLVVFNLSCKIEALGVRQLVMRQFGVYCEAHRPDIGGAWTEGRDYYPVVEYVHAITAEEREKDGMGLHPDMPTLP